MSDEGVPQDNNLHDYDKRRFGRARAGSEGKGLEKRKRGVSPAMDFAAYMDALGLPTKDIAKVAAVHIKTVSHWRGTQDYMERVQYWRSREIEKIEPIINRMKVDALNLVDVAIETLIDTMRHAVHADGRPNYAMRASAAKEALNSSVVRVTIGADSAAAGTHINASQQTVTLVFNDAPPEEPPLDVDDVEELAEFDAVAIELEGDTEGDGDEAQAAEDSLSD